MRIIENSFPSISGKAGDLVHWEHDEKRFKLFHDETWATYHERCFELARNPKSGRTKIQRRKNKWRE